MSHNQDLSTFDLIVVLLLAVGLGALAHLSAGPEKPSTPGASWPDAPPAGMKVELIQTLPAYENTVQAIEPEEALEVETEEESWE